MSVKDILTLIIAAVAAAVALATFVKAFLEYRQQGRQKRAEQFFALRARLKTSDEFVRLAELLDIAATETGEHREDAERELRDTSFSIKREYLGLFEEVALAVNSGLVDFKVAHYMFGYYALLCRDSEAFWEGVNPLSPYWALFNDFCDRMRSLRAEFTSGTYTFDKHDYRF
jgi:hypothetical protein